MATFLRFAGLILLWAATTIALPAQTLNTLHSFDGADGYYPHAGLVQGIDGNFYGTTSEGGAFSAGTVFKISPSRALASLHSFCAQSNCTDGAVPDGALVLVTNGNFFGTTSEGGANFDGTVFKITPSGVLTTLHIFDGSDGIGAGGLVQGTDGNFYGTTVGDGDTRHGTVFKLTPSGTLTTLHSFDKTDGAVPVGALVQATDGNFYGTTNQGGANDAYFCPGLTDGCGTVFKITPSGTLTTLYNFCSKKPFCVDGDRPFAGLVQGMDGNLYGTTGGGGISGPCTLGCGTIFEITPGGTLTTLHSFDSTDGLGPTGLIQATDGNFYGTTSQGGPVHYAGTIFKITRTGTLTTVYNFCSQSSCTDGSNPGAGLVQGTDGNFYGTTLVGGGIYCGGGCGTVFGLSVDLGPFVKTLPTFGKVGTPVKILGTNLTGTTSVTFNDTAAVFTVISSSLIAITVPAGATTGTVQVVTPGGTLSSNVPFRVHP